MFGSWVRSSDKSFQPKKPVFCLVAESIEREKRWGLGWVRLRKKVKISGGLRVVQIEREEGRGWR